jgi:hypothetical protein
MIFSLTLHKRAEKRIHVLLEVIYNSPFANIISVNGGFERMGIKEMEGGSGCGDGRWCGC